MVKISEEEHLKNLIKPYYSGFYNIESFLRMDKDLQEFKETFWNMTAPHFELGEARYYPIKYAGRLIETTLIDPPWSNIGSRSYTPSL